VLDDKDIDGVIIATPNHWHALATIWALQAGKHVYVEKPSTYTVLEGRRMVQAVDRYNKIVQVGTMNRSRQAVQQAIKFLHDGGIGKVYMARGSASSAARHRQVPGRPAGARREVQAARRDQRRTSRRGTARISRRWTTTCGSAPRPSGRSTATGSTTTGTGTGTTATATRATRGRTSSTSRAGAWQARAPGAHPVDRRLLRARVVAGDARHAHDALPLRDGTILEFATRGQDTNEEGGVKIGNLFYGTKGWLWSTATAASGSRTWAGTRRRARARRCAAEAGGSDPNVLTSIEYPHYQNFVDAIRANDPKMLTCDATRGAPVVVAAAPGEHRLPRGPRLTFDKQREQFVGDAEADRLLTREYRRGFELPSVTMTTTAAGGRAVGSQQAQAASCKQ
jgi:hypothetical protein